MPDFAETITVVVCSSNCDGVTRNSSKSSTYNGLFVAGSSAKTLMAVGLFVFFLIIAIRFFFKTKPFGGMLSSNFIATGPENLLITFKLA